VALSQRTHTSGAALAEQPCSDAPIVTNIGFQSSDESPAGQVIASIAVPLPARPRIAAARSRC
jgi:hypothetical protein